jgi:hypothetical protein
MKAQLSNTFEMKDLGKLHYFLGIEVIHTPLGILLTQHHYALNMLFKFGMIACKPVSTSLDRNHKLWHATSLACDAIRFRKIIGSLIYLTITRPDLSYPVGLLSQFMEKPTIEHMDCAHRIIRYISSTLDRGLLYHKDIPIQLQGYTDADWAGSSTDRRSTSGFMFTLGSAAISWSSKKQPIVALSSTEAEYRGAAVVTCEAIWLKRLLKDLQVTVTERITIYCDNISSIQLAKNLVFHARTKHIEVHYYHFVRERVLHGEVDLRHVRTNQQVADIFTKALGVDKLWQFSKMMGLHHLDVPSLRGSARQDGAVTRRQWMVKRESTQKRDKNVAVENDVEEIP